MGRLRSLRKKAIGAGISGLLCVALGACYPNRAPKTIAIGVLVPLTGDVSLTSGRPTLQGVELAVQEANAAGGLEIQGHEHQIVLKVMDHQDDPNKAVAMAKQLIKEEQVVALVGIPLSRNAIPVAKVAEQAEIPLVTSKSTNPATTANKQYVFRATFTDAFQAKMLTTLVRDELELRKAAVLYDRTSDYNQYLAASFRETFTAHGGSVVAFETYVTGDRQFTEQLNTIKAAQPDVLFLPNYPPEALEQIQQARAVGLTATLIGADSWTGFTDLSDPALEGVLFTSDWFAEIENLQSAQFIAAYRQRYQKSPTDTAALGYDAMQLIIAAMRSQESFEPEMLRAGLAQLQDHPGVTGLISYGTNGDPLKNVAIMQIQGGQMMVYQWIKPE